MISFIYSAVDRFLLIMFFAAIWGCASVPSANHSVTRPIDGGLKRFHSLKVIVQSKIEEANEHIPEIKTGIESDLRRTFTLSDANTPPDLILMIKIVEFKSAGQFARLTIGKLAGDDIIKVQASFYDKAAKKYVGTFLVTGSSSGAGGFSGTGGVPVAIEALSHEIGKVVEENL